MKKVFSILICSLCILSMFYSCKGNGDVRKSISVDEFSAMADQLVSGDTVSVRGFCADVCKQGANHITLIGEDSTNAISAVADEHLVSFSGDLTYQYVTVTGILDEQKVDTAFLNNWEYRLDESLKAPDGGNPPAVAVLKEQIRMMRDTIASRNARCGKNYWSNYTIITASYKVDEE